jgi:hypothetical protein
LAATDRGESVGNRAKLSSPSSNERKRRICARRSLAFETIRCWVREKKNGGKTYWSIDSRTISTSVGMGAVAKVANVSINDRMRKMVRGPTERLEVILSA